MARKRRKAVPAWQKMNAKQRNLLEYPPTQTTWICQNPTDYGRCDHYIAGSSNKCTYCGADRPNTPKLLWPEYVKACNIVGIEPGEQKWKIGKFGPIVRTMGDSLGWRDWDSEIFRNETMTRTRDGKTRTRTVKRKT